MTTIKPWQILQTAPHRIMFFGGALQILAVMLWFLLELLTRNGVFWHPIDWGIAPSASHAYLMIYGLFPFFMFGVQMTTFPRWLNGTEISQKFYVPAFMLLMFGAAGFYIGLLTNHTVLKAAICCTLTGWGIALYALMRVLLDTPSQDKRHPKIIFGAAYLGWCCQMAYLIYLVTDNIMWVRFAIEGGLWLFLLPLFVTVAHRMIPFFTGGAIPQYKINTPYWPLWVMLAASACHGLLEFNTLFSWLWVCDAPLAIAALYLSRQWGFSRSLKIPLLAVLHVGFVWLGFAMVLFTVQSLVLCFSGGHTFIWGLAPMHAMTIGFFVSILTGIATRVTLAHSGLSLVLDTPVKSILVGLQIVALLRVQADMLPIENRQWLYVAAGIVWLACFVPWVVRFIPFYWKQRADGQPG